MAPIKFEDDFKEKLDKRNIAPSEGAWRTLSERLDGADNTSKDRKGLWWIAAAASIIGILFVVSQFFTTKVEQQTPVIVDTQDATEIPKKNNFKTLENAESNTAVAVENTEPIQKEPESNQVIYKASNDDILASEETQVQIVQERTVQNINPEKKGLELKNSGELSFESEKAQEVAEAIFNLSETDSGVTNEDIDALLKQAQRAILLNRMKAEDKAMVDAALLLQEVEFELDTSFRDKVFETLRKSYGSVKTAIAHRND